MNGFFYARFGNAIPYASLILQVMKRPFYLFFTLFVFLFSNLNAQNLGNDYTDSILRHRQRTDSTFKYGDGPLRDSLQRQAFTHLNYFPVSADYAVNARFIRLENPERVKFRTSSERIKQYLQYARLEFTVDGKPQVLYAYFSEDLAKKEEYRDYLFIPFTDLTNGHETYGGGRYIEGRIPDGDTFVLDFNLAFNPYCHYSEGYSCPKVPTVNQLPLRIEAGEKLLYTY